MRTLYEIIEAAKDNEATTQEECLHALLAMSALLSSVHSQLRWVCEKPNALRAKLASEGAFKTVKVALDRDPKVWLGSDVPDSPDYQRMRAAGKKLLDRLMENTDE